MKQQIGRLTGTLVRMAMGAAPAIALAACLTVGLSATAHAQAVPDKVQARTLKAMAVPVVLPADVPPGFSLVKVIARIDRQLGASYVAIYEGGDRAFAIESTTGGVGDFPGTPVAWFTASAIKSPRTALYFQAAGDAHQKTWISDWVRTKGHFYRLVGAHYTAHNLDPDFRGRSELDAAWAKRIAASLRPTAL